MSNDMQKNFPGKIREEDRREQEESLPGVNGSGGAVASGNDAGRAGAAGSGENFREPLTLGAAVNTAAKGVNSGAFAWPGEGLHMEGPQDAGKAARPGAGQGVNQGGSSGGFGFSSGRGAPWGNPPSSGGGSWTWVPEGMQPKLSWRKRHPVLFWGAALVFLALIFSVGRMSGNEAAISGPRIAVVQVEGMILDAEDTVAFMEKVRKDPIFKGAILRINSPGGAVGPSQEIYAAAKRLAETKPVVASMSSVAASGGYYAALGARTIVAGPSTLTGSIGVKMQIPNIEGLMRTIGISETTLTTGKLKDAGSSWREMRPDEEAYFRGILGDMYDEFITTVAKERNLTLEKVRAVADGRAMTGRQALEAGLVDELGDFQAAVSKIKTMAGIAEEDSVALVKGPEKERSLFSRLLSAALNEARQQSLAVEQPVFIY